MSNAITAPALGITLTRVTSPETLPRRRRNFGDDAGSSRGVADQKSRSLRLYEGNAKAGTQYAL